MLKKLFKNKMQDRSEEKKKKELIDRISKMDIYSMWHYLDEGNSCELGVEEIVKKLIKKEETAKRRFIEISDSKFKVDKCFELIMNILEHNNLTQKILTLSEKFVYIYSDLIKENDENNKRNYEEKLNNSLFFATKKFSDKTDPEKTECDIKIKKSTKNKVTV